MMHARSEAEQSPHPDIAIVGELNPDLIVYGLPPVLPEEREVLATGFTLTLGSSAAILAHNLSLLGSRVSLTALVGNDLFGEMCTQRLSSAGVDVSRVVRSGTCTGVTLILPLATTRRTITFPGAMFEMGIDDLDLDFLMTARHFHLSSLFLHRKLSPDIPSLFKEIKSRGMTTSLDTNDDPEDKWIVAADSLLRYVDLLFCTEEELCKIARLESVDAAARLISDAVRTLAVKRGARGASIYHEGIRIDRPAVSVQLVDAVGAGDTFDAGFLHQWVHKAPLETCLEFANIAAALSVTRPGGTEAFLDAPYRESFLEQHWSKNSLSP